MDLKLIKSFQIDHDKLKPGMYISRIDGTNGNIVTYDLRLKTPNQGDYLENPALHTIEHLFATFVRSSDKADNIIYFGPMGCRTGFYFITRDLSDEDVVALVKSAFSFIVKFKGKIPGTDRKECGNYLEHDLVGAIYEAETYSKVLENCSKDTLTYPE